MRPTLPALALLGLLASSLALAQSVDTRDSDSDYDGIDDATEDRVLGTGDGNRDGIADARQGQVVSFALASTGRGTNRDTTVSNTELAPNRSSASLTQVRPIDWAHFGGSALGSAPPVQIEASGEAIVLRYDLHHAGLAPRTGFLWLSRTTGVFGQSYFIEVLGSAEQSGDSFALLIEDGGPQDLDKETGKIRAIGFPR